MATDDKKRVVTELQEWIRSVLGEDAAWEVTPENIETLSQLKSKARVKAQHDKVLMQDLERRRCEYEGETKRIKNVVTAVGIHDKALSGLASTFLEVLTECCSKLNVDNIGTELELAVADKIANKTILNSEIVSLRHQVGNMKEDVVGLLRDLRKTDQALRQAEEEGAIASTTTADLGKKLEFMRAKAKQYRVSLDKGLAALAKNSGGDDSLRHNNVGLLVAQLEDVKAKIEPAQAQVEVYCKLPVSTDLARMEVAKARKELADLTKHVIGQLSSTHI